MSNEINLMDDPNAVMSVVMKKLEEVNPDMVITDPTNSFMFALEADVFLTNGAVVEMFNNLSNVFPVLSKEDNIFNHMSDEETKNMFANPSTGDFIFYLKTMDIKNSGHEENGKDYKQLSLPEFTKITVGDLTFTLFNRVTIKRFDSKKYLVEQDLSDNTLAINSLGVLSHRLYTDDEEVEWLIFSTKIKQVKVIENIYDAIGASLNENIEHKTSEQLVNVEAYLNNTGSSELKMNTTYNDIAYDFSTPTVRLKRHDDKVNLVLPKKYITDGTVSGTVKSLVYLTNGRIKKSLGKFLVKDFVIGLGKTSGDPSALKMEGLDLKVSSTTEIDGGVDLETYEAIRKRVINNTVGKIDIPITEHELKEKSRRLSFDLYKSLEVVTKRLYIASRNIDKRGENVKVDLFMNTVALIIDEIDDNNNIIVNDDILVIKSNSYFKEHNGMVSLMTNDEVGEINSRSNKALIQYMNDSNYKYFYSLYHYVIDKTNKALNSRVYDLENPKIDNIMITNKNNNTPIKANIEQYALVKREKCYSLIFNIKSESNFDKLNTDNVKAQLSIPVSDSEEMVYFDTVLDSVNNQMSFNLDTDFYLNVKDDLNITNGTSGLVTKFISLLTKAYIIIYTDDNTIIRQDDLNISNYLKLPSLNNVTPIVRQELTLNIGSKVNFLWDKVTTSFTERKYLKHTANVPARYENDVYEIFPETGSIFKYVLDDDGNCIDVIKNLLHHANDVMVDGDGETIFRHKIGDPVLDANNNPTIDQGSGLIRYVDFLMLSLEYKLANTLDYVSYRDSVYNTVSGWLKNEITELNDNSLDETEILYKPYKSTNFVPIKINESVVNLKYHFKPLVTLFVDSGTIVNNEEKESIKDIIGGLIHSELENSSVNFIKLKDTIISSLSQNTLGVKIEGITKNNLEVFTINDNSNRLTIDKKLEMDVNNKIKVRYDLELKIERI